MNNHKTSGYWRSEIYSYFDLTPEQQVNAVSNYFNNTEEAEQESFVIIPDHSPLPLGMFMRGYGPIFDGYYSTSAFDGFLIKLGRTGEDALIVHRYW